MPRRHANLSPKGTTAVWDDDHLVFANIRSPGTLANLPKNPNVDVNVIDPFVRNGYRFKGVASILESRYDKALVFYREGGAQSGIREIVMIRVQIAQPIDSPAYDLGLTEDQIRDRWDQHFQSLRSGITTPQTMGKQEQSCLARPCCPTLTCPVKAPSGRCFPLWQARQSGEAAHAALYFVNP